MFQIEGRDLLFAWLAKETDSERRLRMLEWMAEFSKEPLAGAERVPNIAAPVYVVQVPLRPPVVLTFLYAFHVHTVRLLKIQPFA